MQTAVLLLALVGCVLSSDRYPYGGQQTDYGSSPSFSGTPNYGSSTAAYGHHTSTPATSNTASHAPTNPAGKPAAPTTPAKPTYADIMCISKGQCKSGIDTAQIVLYKKKEEIIKLMKLDVHEDIAKEVIPLPLEVRMSVMEMFKRERKVDITTEQTGTFTASFDFAFEALFKKPEVLMANALNFALEHRNYVSMVEILFSVSNKGVADILKEYKTINSKEFFEEFVSAHADTTYLPPNFRNIKMLIESKVKIDATKESGESKPVDLEKAKKDAALIYQKLDDNECVEDILHKIFLEDSPEQIKALMNLDFNGGEKFGDPDEAMNFTKLMYEMYPFEVIRKVYITIGSIFKNPHLYYLKKVWDNVRRSGTAKYNLCKYTEVSWILIGRAEIDLGSIVAANPRMTEEIIKKLSVSKPVALFDPTKVHAVLRMITEQARNGGASATSSMPHAANGYQVADNGSGYGTGNNYRRADSPPAPEYGTGRRADAAPNPGFGTGRGYERTQSDSRSGYGSTYTPTADTGYRGTGTGYGGTGTGYGGTGTGYGGTGTGYGVSDYGTNSQGTPYTW